MSATLPIIVYSDVICPWCYVGKRRLETALGAPDMPEQVELRLASLRAQSGHAGGRHREECLSGAQVRRRSVARNSTAA